jgi:hypothetical protein
VSLFLTGRQRTLTDSGSTSGGINSVCYYAGTPIVSGHPTVHEGSAPNTASVGLTAPCGAFQMTTSTTGGSAGATYNISVSLSLQISVIGGFTASGSGTVSASGSVGAIGSKYLVSETCAGSYTFSADVEEVVDIEVGTDWPSYGGTAVPDPPFDCSVTFFERTKIGGSVSGSVTLGPASASLTATTVANSTISYTHSPSLTNASNHGFHNGEDGGASSPGVADTLSITLGFSGEPVYIPAYSYAGTGGSVTATTCSVSGNPYDVDLNSPTSFQDYSAAVSGSMTPNKSYTANGAIRAMDQGYPSPITVRVDQDANNLAKAIAVAAGGDWSLSIDQHQYSVVGVIDGVTDPSGGVSLNEWHAFRAWVDGPSLTSLGEDSADWRMMIRGRRFDSFTLGQDAKTVLDDCSTADFIPINNCTVSGGGGVITVVVGEGGGGSFSITKAAGKMGGYRYLDFVCAVDTGPATGTLTLGSKSWDTFGIAQGAVSSASDLLITEVDLCAPTSATSDTDANDTRWPTFAETDYWGVETAPSCVISGLQQGTYTFATVRLIASASLCCFLPAWNNWTSDGTDGNHYVRNRFLHGQSGGGKQEMEETDFTKYVDPDTGLSTYTIRTLSQLVSDINNSRDPGQPSWENQGWAAVADTFDTSGCSVATPAESPCWLNNSLPAVFAYGAGALYGAGGWDFGIDKSFPKDLSVIPNVQPKTVVAQALWDQVEWYPGIGDAWQWSGGGYGGGITFALAKIYRAEQWGLSYHADKTPDKDDPVVLTEHTSGAAGGSGSPDSTGLYYTASPCAVGGHTYDAKRTADGVTLTITREMQGRRRYRGVYAGGSPQVMCNRVAVIPLSNLGYGRLFYAAGGNVYQVERFAGVGAPGKETEGPATVVASGSAPCAHRDGRGVYHLWYMRSGSIYYKYDAGNGWGSERLAVSGYTCPGSVYVPEIHRVEMAAISGGHIKVFPVQQAGPADLALTPDTGAAVDLGSTDNVCPALEMLHTGVLRVWWVYNGNLQSQVSYDGGNTWQSAP